MAYVLTFLESWTDLSPQTYFPSALEQSSLLKSQIKCYLYFLDEFNTTMMIGQCLWFIINLNGIHKPPYDHLTMILSIVVTYLKLDFDILNQLLVVKAPGAQ